MGKKCIAIALRIDEPYPHHQRVFDGIQRYAREKGDWHCLIDEHPGFNPRLRGDFYLKYDGVIARADEGMQQRLKRMGIPLVNTHYQNKKPGLPGVYADPVAMGRLAAEHLIDRGFRRLSMIGDVRHKHTSEIMRAFVRRAEEEEIVDCSVLEMDEQSYEEPSYWIKLEKQLSEQLAAYEPPFGVFVETAPHARLLIQLGQAKGLSVPQDLAVLCQYNLRAVVDVSPQISRLDMNYELIGYRGAEMLDRLMSGEPLTQTENYVPPIGIIGRESTDYFAVEDEIVSEALSYISTRLSDKLRIDDIAYELAVSPSLLKKRFAASLGRGVGEEIRRLRLEVAKRMLTEEDRSIASIARDTGFNSSDVMNQVFQRELGVTPSAFRNQLLGKDANQPDAQPDAQVGEHF